MLSFAYDGWAEGIVKTLAILVGGGPAPGINAVISAATIEARNHGLRVLGCYDGFKWLVQGGGSVSHDRLP